MNDQVQGQAQETGLTITRNPAAPILGATIWNTPELMAEAYKMAEMLSRANILPQDYRGNPGDCLVAIDMANRMGISPLMVMQQSQMVHGNFSWKGTACKSFIDGCGKFRNSRYEFSGEEGTDERGCQLVAERVSTGETVKGTKITIAMAKAEGWYSRSGSKWKTMPEQMLCYRAAAFFARREIPEVLMGFHTADEVGDVLRVDPDAPEEIYYCEECKKEITPTEKEPNTKKIRDFAKRHFGKELCAACQRKRLQKPTEPSPAPENPDPAPPQETPLDEWAEPQEVL